MENIIEQAFIGQRAPTPSPPNIFRQFLRTTPGPPRFERTTLAGRLSLEKAVMEFEREIILDALEKNNYMQTHAATQLGNQQAHAQVPNGYIGNRSS